MKKNSIILMIIISILLASNAITLADKTSEEKQEEYEEGYKVGENFGYFEGINQAINESEGDKKPSYERPKYVEVEERYKAYLFQKSKDYINGFLNGFYIGHVTGFNDTINSDNGAGSIGKTPDAKYGESLGIIYGNIAAHQDFIKGKKSNWVKAMPKTNDIVDIFALSKETSLYRSVFIKEFKDSFEKGYKQEYERNLLEPQDVSLDTGTSDGEAMGSILGAMNGARDYRDRKKINYKISIPRDTEIIKKYSLNLDSEKYKEAFLRGFKLSYEKAYNEGYRAAMIEQMSLESTSGYDNGYSVGIKAGEVQARRDYDLNKRLNWEKHKVTDIDIIKENDLLYQKGGYRETFIDGYWTGFSEGYRTVFQSLNGEDRIKSSSSSEIPMSGGSLASGDSKMMIIFEKGTFYNDIYSTIDTISKKKYSFKENYISASDMYKIENTNLSQNYDNQKPITLSFEYYGGKNGGIYKFIDGEWVYLYSTMEDGSISTKVSPSALNNSSGTYAVFIDKNAPLLLDIRSHWAKDEIETLVRRTVISGYSNKTFRPDKDISRSEFLILLSRVYDWKLQDNVDNVKVFKDYSSFNRNDKIISYAYEKGYINGYADNTFRPEEPISYKEVEIIIGRILQNPNFRWYNTAAKMLYEKKVKSKSYDNMNNNISRAEVSYMLYLLNQWKY